MDVEIIDNSDFDARLIVHRCSNCNEPQLTELDLRNHLLSCQKAKEESIIELDDESHSDKEIPRVIKEGKDRHSSLTSGWSCHAPTVGIRLG